MRNATLYKPRILVIEGLWSELIDIIDSAGGDAFEVPAWSEHDIENHLMTDSYDAVVLTGGSDISPALYGEKPDKSVYGVDHARDQAEVLAMMYAEEQGIPVLGICRGSQIMCAYKGGKLTQDIDGHRGGTHPVVATPEARTFKRAINSRGMDVVSLHHQCVRRPGKGMRIAARAMDGTPEAIESKDGTWLGVQFHPEMAAWNNGNAFAIFQWLVQTATRVKAKRVGKPLRAAHTRFRDVRPPKKVYTPKATGRNRQAGTRPFSNATGLTTSEFEWDTLEANAVPFRDARTHTVKRYSDDNPCPCKDGDCIYGFKCGSGFPSGANGPLADQEAWEAVQAVTPDAIITHEAGEETISFVCPSCAMVFDFKGDRDAHVQHSVCTSLPWASKSHQYKDYDSLLVARYPELEPPKGHPAWEDDVPSEEELTAIEADGARILEKIMGQE